MVTTGQYSVRVATTQGNQKEQGTLYPLFTICFHLFGDSWGSKCWSYGAQHHQPFKSSQDYGSLCLSWSSMMCTCSLQDNNFDSQLGDQNWNAAGAHSAIKSRNEHEKAGTGEAEKTFFLPNYKSGVVKYWQPSATMWESSSICLHRWVEGETETK